MATISILSQQFDYEALTGKINLTSDTLKVLLMRSGFSFDREKHKFRKNIKGTITGSSNIDFSSSDNSITISDGGFVDAGFVAGNKITITGTTNNNMTVTITSVEDTKIVVDGTLTDESGTSAVITADDELPAGNGYTQEEKELTNPTAQINTYDSWEFSYPAVVWTATGGDIGPTPGAIIYDNSHPDKVIVGYIDFGQDYTANDGETLTISGIAISTY